ncbi:MAG: glycosyltransferase family 4 protein [Candidatus Moranbacteria bacterium]|nr:glycosyltransferase family 4 protein [Candidatus Moranbacteria bacterium]
MKKTILFLSEMPITNGVIQSQLMPIILRAANDGYAVEIMETTGRFDSQEKDRAQIGKKLEHWMIALKSIAVKRHTLLPSIIYFTWKAFGIVRDSIRKNGSNQTVIYARNYKFAPLLLLAKYLWGVSYIYSPRGAYVAERRFYKKTKDLLFASFIAFFERKAILGSTKIIVETDGFKEHLKELYSLEDRRFEVIPNCYDASLLPSSDWNRDEMRKELGFSGKKVIAYAGTVEVWYEFEKMIDLVSRLRKKDPSIFFQLFLKEDYARDESSGMLTELDTLMEKYGLAKNESYGISSYAPTERYRYLSACDAGICLSVPQEFKSMMLYLKIVDFIGARLPMIVNSEMTESVAIIKESGAGAVVDYGDWEKSVADIDLENLFNKKNSNLDLLKKYSSSEIVPKYMELFKDAFKEK